MRKHASKRRLTLGSETIGKLGIQVISPDELRYAAGGSAQLSCDGVRCSNDSACAATDTHPFCPL